MEQDISGGVKIKILLLHPAVQSMTLFIIIYVSSFYQLHHLEAEIYRSASKSPSVVGL